MNNIIKKYIDNLTIKDINDFAIKKDINLNDSELNIIYKKIKENLDEILNHSEKVFESIKKDLTDINYNKIYKLFYEYKKRYKNYL